MPASFRQFALAPEILAALDDAGYERPTPIQERALPPLLAGRDLIGVAETGTGKTLAFLLPILQQLDRGTPDPGAVVICPTRELAQQVAAEAERFGARHGVRMSLVYGGTSSGEQKKKLAAGCDLLIGTPGRLLDLLQSAWVSLRRVRHVVLDEADRMLDMGFIHDVDAILRRTPASRQTMLFSATVPDAVRRLADRYLHDPEIIRMHAGTRVARSVEHRFLEVSESAKVDRLLDVLAREKPGKTLVFTATREGTSELAAALRRGRHHVVSLSSLLSQANRERALDAFRTGACPILVATDVAGRGLDILDIDLVVNFDVPLQPEDYVHRIGRTGRATRAGKAITLVSEADERRAAHIERLLGETIIRERPTGAVPRASAPSAPRRRSRRRGARGRSTARQGRG
jgi:superfamily II DNA/RNA helicase